LAKPPMAGLQDMVPMDSLEMVIKRVLHPIRAAAKAASQPACPAPMAMTSKVSGITYYGFYHTCYVAEDFFLGSSKISLTFPIRLPLEDIYALNPLIFWLPHLFPHHIQIL